MPQRGLMQVRVAKQNWEAGSVERTRQAARLAEQQAALKAAEQQAWASLQGAEQVLAGVLAEQDDQ